MKTSRVELRVTPSEKEGFELAAEVAGMPTAGWMRVQLRLAAVKQLEEASIPSPFNAMKKKI
jgi:hypothetical protein